MMLRDNKGFTLVETLVTGIIAAIIASSVFVAYIAYDRRARESIAYLKMQRQYDNAVEQIARDVRNARSIMPAADACVFPVFSADSSIKTAITLYDEVCGVGRSYSISGDTLKQGSAPINVGWGAVLLASGSGFLPCGERNGVEVRLKIKTKDRDNVFFELPLRREFFRCRQR